MSFWTKSTGETLSKQTATAEFQAQTDLPPIPDKTVVKAAATEIKWDLFTKDSPDGKTLNGERYVNVRWDVIDGEFQKRVIFQKIKVSSAQEKTRDNAIDMLAAIDMNASGGKLMTLGREPSDMELMTLLANKPMHLRLRVWTSQDKTASGNWIDAVSSAKGSKPAQRSVTTAPIVATPAPEVPAEDEELDF
jgi:hypothetical protein